MLSGSIISRVGRSLGIAVFLAGLGAGAFAQQNVSGVLDFKGQPVDPFAAAGNKVVVLIFVRGDCPISSRYAPEIKKISAEFADDAVFWLVYPDRNDSAEAIGRQLRDYGYHLPALRDPSHTLVKLARVQITPEVAVFDHGHRLIYDGRIDDWYADVGRVRALATTHELEDAIRAAGTGKAVAKAEVRGVGCYISDLD